MSQWVWTGKTCSIYIIYIQLHVWIYIEFVINNVSPQGNNVKTKLNLKVEETCRDCRPNSLWNKWQRTSFLFSFIRGIFKTLWKIISIKIVDDWIRSIIFAKSSILPVSPGCKYVSEYRGVSSIIIWDFYFESFRNFSNLICILLMYLQQKFSC